LGNSAVLILGIKAYHGDVSAVLIHDGDLVVAVEEERGSRDCRVRSGEPWSALGRGGEEAGKPFRS
jgi:predicted NodU family carbamoyl transferase